MLNEMDKKNTAKGFDDECVFPHSQLCVNDKTSRI